MPETSRIFRFERSLAFPSKMKPALTLGILVLAAVLFAGCESSLKSAPPVTAAFVRAGVREKADEPTLMEGRKVLLNRCIACHALPDPTQYDSQRLTRSVGWMSGRARLT